MARRGSRIYILFKKDEVVNVWTNLKQLCQDMNEQGSFVSYAKLSRPPKIEGERLEFKTKDKTEYSILFKLLQ